MFSSQRIMRQLLFALTVAIPVRAELLRQSLPFDFGWTFRAGLHDWPIDPYQPPMNATEGYIDPGVSPNEAQPDYKEEHWIPVTLPHDGIVSNPKGNRPSLKACPDGCSGKSYIPRHVLWYRKQFRLPHGWNTDQRHVSLRFDGAFRNTTVYLNGHRVYQHECGYTPFSVPLPPSTSQDDTIITLAVFCDPNNGDEGGMARGSGWWYEGGGLYRHVFLESQPARARIVAESVVATSTINFADASATLSLKGSLRFSIDFVEDLDDYCYNFHMASRSGEGAVVPTPLRSVSRRERELEGLRLDVQETVTEPLPTLWTWIDPHRYQISLRLYHGCSQTNQEEDGRTASETEPPPLVLVDQVSISHGIRALEFTADEGFFWNTNPFKIRGFCDHDTFAVVGMAVPDRIQLYRAQLSRSIGGNARRASHNPPDPIALEIYDRLGMLVVDENRLFGNQTRYVDTMAELVVRDRNHPSVVLWSFCNEVGCQGGREAGGPAFANVTHALDPSRPTLANMLGTEPKSLSDVIDVQGLSHRDRATLDRAHYVELPHKPLVQSECCSCNTMRGVDGGCETIQDNPKTECDQASFNGRCLERLVNASDGTTYAAGTFVWTLLDYYGEPPSRPLTVSSTYGQFDLCGFPKAAAYWFRSQWLLGHHYHEDLQSSRLPSPEPLKASQLRHRQLGSTRNAQTAFAEAIANGKPFSTGSLVEVYIVESWESPQHWNHTKDYTTKTIHVYSNAPIVELLLQGGNTTRTLGSRALVPMVQGDGGTYGEWLDIPWECCGLVAIARSTNGTELARSVRTVTEASRGVFLKLSLDCPSPSTGTGSALFLDGSDVALVRATLVGSDGIPKVLANHTVCFAVVEGPGRILGTANGDPKSKRSHTNTCHPAHYGLVRLVLRVTSLAGYSAEEKRLLRSMEVAGEGSGNNHHLSYEDARDIVIEATSPGLAPVRLTIPTSTNRREASVLEVAARAAGLPVPRPH